MRLKSFIGDGENFVVDALINFQPVERFENRRDTAESRGSRNSTSSRVENELKTIKLTTRKIKKKGVAVINLRMNERCGNSMSRSIVKRTSDSSKVTNS